MPDIASIGLELNSKQVVEGTKALDALGASATAVEPKMEKVTKAADDLGKASAQVWRYGTDAAKSVDSLGEATVRTGARVATSNGQMNDTVKIMRAQAEEAKAVAAANVALGTSSNQASIGAQIFIDKLKDQVAVLGMSRSQLVAYQAAQLGVSTQAQQSVAALKAYEDAIKATTDAKAAAAAKSNQLTDALGLLAKGYAALKIAELVKDTAMLNARYEELGVVMRVVGANTGYSAAQMQGYSDGVQKSGISMLESRQSVIKLAQAHIDLSHAAELARGAQDAAVIGGINSSEAFDRLVNGISRGNVLILRNLGINVNLQNAYQDMAATLGITTKELSENERVEARRIAVTERLVDLNGVYAASMDTAAKQIRSTTRYIEDLKTVQGEIFNEALTIAVMAFTNQLKDAGSAAVDLKNNGSLKEWGADVTSTLAFIADSAMGATVAFRLVGKTVSMVAALAASGGQAQRDAILAAYSEDVQNVAASTHMFRDAVEQRRTAVAQGAAERLELERSYAANALIVQKAYANESVEIQRKAQFDLAAASGQSTKPFLGASGGDDRREPKPKVDKVESTELADRLARIQDDINAEKAMYDTMSKMDDMFHAAGKIGDEQFYQNKRDYAAAAAKDQIDGYTKQIADLRAYHNGTEAEAAKHAKQINDIEAKRTAADAAAQDERNLLDAKEFLRKDAIESSSDEALNKYLAGLDQEAKKLEESNSAHETSRASVERETVALYDQAIAYQKNFIAQQAANGATADEIAQAPVILKTLEDERAARERIAAGLEKQQSIQYKDKAADQAIKDWQRAGQSISESLTSAFGEGGKALGGMFQAYAKGMEGQLRAQKELAAAKKLADTDPDKVAAINRAQLAGAQSQIQSYAGMTSAAQGFFAEGSRGYQAMHAATMVLQGAEIALSLVKGVNAVLTQGEGDPYSAFARMAAMAAMVVGLGVAISAGGSGGGGQSAAEVQKVQGAGSVFGDSSAKSDSIRRSIEALKDNSDSMLPINQGMLTALVAIQSAMTGLTNLVVRTPGITDGSNLGIQTGLLSGGTAVSNLVASIGEKVFGTNNVLGTLSRTLANLYSNTKQTIVDSGLQYGGSVRGLQQGQGFEQYASVDTTKSSFFGLSKKTTNAVQTAGLNDELSIQFGMIFTNLDNALQAASVALGGSAADVTKVLDNLTLESTKVSLKGLTGTALTDALNSVISKSMDEIAAAAFPQLQAFRQVGEGYAETVLRLAGDYAKLDAVLAASCTTFGATGIASIAAREHLIELAGGIDQLASQSNSFAENFLSKAEQLAPVQKYVTDQLAAMGLQGIDTRDKFKDVVLGLANSGALATDAGAKQYTALLALADAFAKTHAATEDLTKTEQEIGDERKDLQGKLDELTMTQAQLADKARAAIDGHNLALYDQVQAAQAAKDVLDLQSQLYDLTGNKAAATALLERQHIAALSGMSPALADATKALWNAQAAAAASKDVLGDVSKAYADLQAVVGKQKDDLNASYELASTALKGSIDSVTDSVAKLKSLSDALHSTLDSMTIPGNEKNDRLAAQAQIEAALAIAKAGGPLPTAEDLKGALSTVAKDASGQFASYTDYMRDLYRTKNNVGGLSGLTDAELSTEQLTLKSLNDQKTALDAAHKEDLAKLDATLQQAKTQTDLLSGIYTSLLTLPQALAALGSAVATAQANPTVGATTGLASLYQSLLGRAPDAAGLAFWQMQVANGASLDAVKGAITTSSEYTKLHPPGFASGGDHVGGLRIVGESGPEIEATGPSRILNANQTKSMIGGSSEALLAEIRALRSEVRALQAPAERSATSNEKVSKVVARVGGQGDYFMVKAVPA